MIFMIGRTLARAASGASAKKTGPKPDPTPAGPFAVAVIVILTVVFGALLARHSLPFWYAVACPVAAGVVALGSLFTRGVSDAQRAQRKLADLPNPENTAFSSAQLRQRAASCPDQGIITPEINQSPAEELWLTRRQMTAVVEDDKRTLRVAGILAASCPLCGAESAALACKPLPGRYLYILDRSRGAMAHAERIAQAVNDGTAKITEVVAQFDGAVPDEIWGLLL